MEQPSLRQAVLDRAENEKLSCAQAHAIAQAAGAAPLAVGRAADDAGVRISRCQLGLFGYGSKAEGTDKIVQAASSVPGDLAAELRAASDGDGIDCDALWRVADGLGYGRLEASNAAEGLGLRVARCQLGCFPRSRKGR